MEKHHLRTVIEETVQSISMDAEAIAGVESLLVQDAQSVRQVFSFLDSLDCFSDGSPIFGV